MNNSPKLDSRQSLLSELSENSQPQVVLDISSNSHNGNANTTEVETERSEARALKEEIIKLSREFFATLGQKLKYYRERKLYRFEAKTFGQWCEQEIGLKRNYAYKLIAAFEVYDHIQRKMSELLLSTIVNSRSTIVVGRRLSPWKNLVTVY